MAIPLKITGHIKTKNLGVRHNINRLIVNNNRIKRIEIPLSIKELKIRIKPAIRSTDLISSQLSFYQQFLGIYSAILALKTFEIKKK